MASPRHLARCGALAGVLVVSGCATAGPPMRAPSPVPPAAAAPAPGAQTARVSPLQDPRGLHPGLSPVPVGALAAARAVIAKAPTAAPGSLEGYARVRDFGPAWTDDNSATWGHDGCATREEILVRDLRAPTFRAHTDGCVVLTGQLREPYTGALVSFSKAHPTDVQIDHVMPLAYDWAQGARGFSRAERVDLANDPLNLLAVDGPTNEGKGDQGPATWLPPDRRIDCAYSVRFALVSAKYMLPVTPADKAAMGRSCR